MDVRTGLVAILCSAILSAGLAIGLGASGGAEAAGGDPATAQLKAIKAQLVKANTALGDFNVGSLEYTGIQGMLDDVKTSVANLHSDLGDVHDDLGAPSLGRSINDELREICKNTAKTAGNSTTLC